MGRLVHPRRLLAAGSTLMSIAVSTPVNKGI
jgi:hypothetical protein